MIDLLNDLINLLEQEKTTLEQRDLDKLEAITTAKKQLIEKLENFQPNDFKNDITIINLIEKIQSLTLTNAKIMTISHNQISKVLNIICNKPQDCTYNYNNNSKTISKV